MTEQTDKTKWTMTAQQAQELADRQSKRWGVNRLLSDLTILLGREVQAERDWWDAACKYHNIPAEYRPRLEANPELGLIWLRGDPKREHDAPGLMDGEI